MEENNALKNILKGAVIACDDDGMQDVGSYYEYPLSMSRCCYAKPV